MSTTQPIRDYGVLQQFKEYYQYAVPNPRNFALCIMGLNTALRIQDILTIRWEQVWNFQTDEFTEHLMIAEQKTGKKSVIALNQAVKDALHLLYQSMAVLPDKEEYLFTSRRGVKKPLSRYQAYRIIKTAAENVGMPEHISCHSLRKTFGYHAWKQGTPPAMLMNIYNHSSYQITKRYLGIEQDDRDKIFLNIRL